MPRISVCRGACNLGTSTIECIKSGGRDLDVLPNTPCMLRRLPRIVSSRGVLVVGFQQVQQPIKYPPRPGARADRADAAARAR